MAAASFGGGVEAFDGEHDGPAAALTFQSGPFEPVVVGRQGESVTHSTRVGSACGRGPGGCLDHYLEVLVRKPGALHGATALVQTRAAGTFTNAHEAFWVAARKTHGDGGGTPHRQVRRAYGFHSPRAALALIMLFCGPIDLVLPHERATI